MPAELTVGFAVVPPETTPGPAQLKFVPFVVAADRTMDVVVHVSVPPVALAPGFTQLTVKLLLVPLWPPPVVRVAVIVKLPGLAIATV